MLHNGLEKFCKTHFFIVNQLFMYTRFLLFISFVLLHCTVFGQQNRGEVSQNSIKGFIVEDGSNEPLEFATISVFNKKDSSLIGGGISEANGSFNFEVKPAKKMYAEIEFIGFQTKLIDDIPVGKQDIIDLGQIVLSVGGVALDAIEVRAERSEMEFSLDKRVFNVGKDLASRGGNASDILDNIPSVSVGVEGDVSLRGSGNVRILINGRPSGLVGLSGTDGLRTIQANMIERVEVITNPSSKFEAEGMAGIINIILKKNRAKGFNGSFELSGGSPLSYGAGANLNYRQNDLNWFVNYNYRRRTGPSDGYTYQEFYKNDTTAVSLQESLRDRAGYNHSFRFGSDYMLGKDEYLTASFLYRYGKDDNYNTITYRDTSFIGFLPGERLVAEDFMSWIERVDEEIEKEPTLEYSLNYDKKYDKKGHRLKADLSYQSNTESEASDFNEYFVENDVVQPISLLSQRSRNDEGQSQWRAQIDYTRPIDDSRLETGALGTFRNINNDYLVETLVDGIWQNEVGLSNNFIYNENVIGAYANYGTDYEKWSYQVGVRSEYSQIKTELLQSNEVNDRDYLNLFPSGFLSYKLGGNNSMQASYSRRIRRPRFWDLNPFFTFTDRRNFFSGNPNLDPEYTNSYEMSYLKFWDWGNLSSSVYYRHTTDLITRIQTQDVDNQTTIRRPENIGTQKDIGFEMIFVYSSLDWLRLDAGLNAYNFNTEGISQEGEVLEANNFAWSSNLNARFSFWKNTDLQTRIRYRSGRQTVQGSYKSMLYANVALSKDVTPDLTVTFSVRDVFNQRRRYSFIETADLYQESRFQWRPRSFNLTLNYRINKKKDNGRGGKGGDMDGGDGGDF